MTSGRYEPDLVMIKRDPPLVMKSGCKVIGTLIETIITRDRYEEMDIGYLMIPVRPTKRHIWPFDIVAGPEWRIFDSSDDYKTTWARDVFLIVEKQS
jgi:hypothetical protein